MNKNELEQNKYINTLYSIVDKLEQRIAALEKVLESHAKCIGEMREEDIKTWTTKNTSGDETIWVGRK
jgi:hypothetical protein